MKAGIAKYVMGVLSALLVTPHAEAGSGSGYITSYLTFGTGQFFVTVDGPHSGAPGCATAAQRWVVDGSTVAGQAIVASLLTAYSLHKSIGISGTGTCSVWGDTETAAFIYT